MRRSHNCREASVWLSPIFLAALPGFSRANRKRNLARTGNDVRFAAVRITGIKPFSMSINGREKRKTNVFRLWRRNGKRKGLLETVFRRNSVGVSRAPFAFPCYPLPGKRNSSRVRGLRGREIRVDGKKIKIKGSMQFRWKEFYAIRAVSVAGASLSSRRSHLHESNKKTPRTILGMRQLRACPTRRRFAGAFFTLAKCQLTARRYAEVPRRQQVTGWFVYKRLRVGTTTVRKRKVIAIIRAYTRIINRRDDRRAGVCAGADLHTSRLNGTASLFVDKTAVGVRRHRYRRYTRVFDLFTDLRIPCENNWVIRLYTRVHQWKVFKTNVKIVGFVTIKIKNKY